MRAHRAGPAAAQWGRRVPSSDRMIVLADLEQMLAQLLQAAV
jgi:hypothetical protein